jgi:hypothetical protein
MQEILIDGGQFRLQDLIEYLDNFRVAFHVEASQATFDCVRSGVESRRETRESLNSAFPGVRLCIVNPSELLRANVAEPLMFAR